MAVFTVIIDDASDLDKVKSRMQEHYPKSYPYHANDHIFFVKSDDLSGDIADKLGIGDDEKTKGAVLKMNSAYSGYTLNTIWEWLDND